MGAPDFISDEDFKKLEASASPDFISDEDMKKVAPPKDELSGIDLPGPYGKKKPILNAISKVLPNTAAGLDAVGNVMEGVSYNTPIVSPIAQKMASATIAAVKTPFNDKTFKQNYKAMEAEQDAERNKFNQEHPIPGALGGMLGSVVIPMPGGTGLIPSAVRVGEGAAVGAASGALTAEKPADIADRALTGAAWGTAGGLAGEALGAGVNALAGRPKVPLGASADEAAAITTQHMKETAAEKAVESLGPTKGQVKDLMSKGETSTEQIQAVGQTLHDQKIIKPLRTKMETDAAVTAKLNETGEAIGNQLRELDDFGSKYLGQADGVINPKDLANQIQTQIIDPASKNVAFRSSGALNEANRIVAELNSETTNWTLAQANQQKTQIGKLVSNWGAENLPGKNFVKEIYGTINKEIETKAGAIGTMRQDLIDSMTPASAQVFNESAAGVPTLKQFQTNKDLYGNLSDAKNITKQAAAGELKNNDVGLTTYTLAGPAALGAYAAASNGMPLAAAASAALPVAREFGRRYGDQLTSLMMHKFSGMGKYVPALQRASEQGMQSLAVTNYLLSQQDPEYKSAYDNAMKKLPQD